MAIESTDVVAALTTDEQVDRNIQETVESALEMIECVALIGPRQVGKTTLAHRIIEDRENSVYRDLDDPEQREEVGNGVEFFNNHRDALIVLDEIQNCPDLFPALKAHIDRQRRENRGPGGKFLLLGSASLDLQQHAAASLTGRYREVQMMGLLPTELRATMGKVAEAELEMRSGVAQVADQAPANVDGVSFDQVEVLWCRGGLPRSFLAADDEISVAYRRSFIENYLRNDIRELGFDVDSRLLERCFRYLASVNGCEFKKQTFADALGTDHASIDQAIGVLNQLLLIRILEPWSLNVKHRVTRRPTIYIRDSGILHNLLELETIASLQAHDRRGHSWEGFVIESLIGTAVNSGKYRGGYYFRTDDGSSELDFVLDRGGGVTWGFEIKCGNTPRVSIKNTRAADMIGVERRFLIHTGVESFMTKQGDFEGMPLTKALGVVSGG